MRKRHNYPVSKGKVGTLKKQKKKNFHLSRTFRIAGFMMLACVMLSVLIGIGLWYKHRYELGIYLYKNYIPAFAPGDTVREYSDLSLDSSFNLLLVGLDRKDSGHIKSDGVLLAHYDPLLEVFQIIGLPTKTYYFDEIEDEWFRLSDIYAIGQLCTPEQGMMRLQNVVGDSLALEVDGYIAVDFMGVTIPLDILGKLLVQNEEGFSDNDLGEKGLREHFKQGALKLGSEDTLAYLMADDGGFLSQVNRFYSVLSSAANIYSRSLAYRVFGSFDDLNGHIFSNLSGDSIRDILDLIERKDSLVLSTFVPIDIVSEREINESRLITFDRDKFDKFVISIFENQEIIREQARIEVYNGTSVSGLALKYSRWIKNFGGDVIRISNKSGDYDSTIIFTSDISKFPKTISRLEVIFPDAQIVEDFPHFTVTGDITILLAEDAVGS